MSVRSRERQRERERREREHEDTEFVSLVAGLTIVGFCMMTWWVVQDAPDHYRDLAVNFSCLTHVLGAVLAAWLWYQPKARPAAEGRQGQSESKQNEQATQKPKTKAKIKVRPTRVAGALRCGYCHDDLNEGSLHACARCGTELHEACAEEAVRCVSVGCRANLKVTRRRAA